MERISKEVVRSSRQVSKCCLQCQKPFDIFVRVHVCKRCLKPVCSNCSPQKEFMANYDLAPTKKHRICKGCATENDFQKALIKDHNLSFGKSSTFAVRWLADLKIIKNPESEVEIQQLENLYQSASSANIIQKVDISQMGKMMSYSYRDFLFKLHQKNKKSEDFENSLVALLNRIAAKLDWKSMPHQIHQIASFFLALSTPGQAFALIVHIYENIIPGYILEFANASGTTGRKELSIDIKSKILQMVDYLVKFNEIDRQESKHAKFFLSAVGIQLAASLFVDILSFECSFKAIDLMIQKNSFLEVEKLLMMMIRHHRQYIQATFSETTESYQQILLYLIRNTSISQLRDTYKDETQYEEFVLQAMNESLLMSEIPQPSKEFLEGMHRQHELNTQILNNEEITSSSAHSHEQQQHHIKHTSSQDQSEESPSNINIVDQLLGTSTTHEQQNEMFHSESESDDDDEREKLAAANQAAIEEMRNEYQKQINLSKELQAKSEQRSQTIAKALQQKERENETYAKLISQKEQEIITLKQQKSNVSENQHMHNKTAIDRLWKEIQALQQRNETIRETTVSEQQRFQKEKEELIISSQNQLQSSATQSKEASKLSLDSQLKLSQENANLLNLLSEREASIVKKDSEIVQLRKQIQILTEEKDRSRDLQDQIRKQLHSKATINATYQSGVNEQVAQLHKNIRDLRTSHETALEMQRNLMRWDSEKHVLEIEELNSTVHQHEDTIAALRKELAELNANLNSSNSLLGEKKATLQEAEKQKDLTDSRIAQLNAGIEEHLKLIEEYKTKLAESQENELYLKEDVRRLVEFVYVRDCKLQDVNAINAYNIERANELQSQCDSQRARIIEFEEVNREQAALIEELKSQVAGDAQRFAEEKEEINKRLRVCEEELARDSKSLKETRDLLHETQTNLANITENHSVSSRENQEMRDQIDSLKQVVVKEAQRANSAENQVDTLTQENKKLEEQLEEERRAAHEKNHALIHEVDHLKHEKEELLKQLHALQHAHDHLKEDCNHKEHAITDYISKAKHHEEQHSCLKDTLNERETSLSEKDTTIEDLRRQLAQTQAELKTTQDDLNKYLSIFVSVKNTVVTQDPSQKSAS